MKKTFTAGLMITLALSTAACGAGNTQAQTTQPTQIEETQASQTEAEETEASPAEAEQSEAQATEAEQTEALQTSEAMEEAAEEQSESHKPGQDGGSRPGGFDKSGNSGSGGPGGRNGGGSQGGRQGGGTDKSSDAELQAMITEIAPKFELLTFQDEETGAELQYQLYVPDNYDPSQSYPLIQFIPDSSVVGRDAETVLTQGWGGLIWATEAEQEKHPAFVVVPVFTETVVNDNFEHSEQIETAVRLLKSLTETYSIDTDRIYTTGQSMGGMTSFYLNITYPDLFAASLFVGSQWDNSLLSILEDRDFFYIVAAGDPKASAGQAELMQVFDTDNAAYSHEEWSAQDPADIQNAAVEAMLAEGNRANFVTFTEGSTMADGTASNSMAGEHMTSFDYAYKLEAVRDWLFSQTKSE